ncbi:MFS transporter [Leucobacter tardus]|uniref:MFS transporter n=1 Tax=Leucobacter tardus TaxID=501483 RepID=A0A939QMB2_9MICO|nr:MFS transporter [Leucobacter tardus]MBO2990531.1 MFS transporter [Leucobacter tardus]
MTAPTPVLTPARRTIALFALALGGFGIGVTEFASMGLLPDIAQDLLPGYAASPTTEIARAGILITMYALGVVVGAPVFAALGARASHAKLTFLLLVLFIVGTIASALAPTFGWLAAFRFIAALPHGAYFGVASLIAARIMGPGNQGKGVALAISGLTVANVVGVPLATWLGQHLGWRWAYVLVAVIFAVTLALTVLALPRTPGDPTRHARAELRAFRNPRTWIMIAVGSIGFGGFFAVYSYIAEVSTEVAGLSTASIPWVLAVMGIGMTLGNLIGGWASDRDLTKTIVVGFSTFIVSLILYTWLAPTPVGLFVTVFLIGITQSMLIPSIQARLIRIADRAALLGAAVNHAAFNIGNGLGAALGGAVIAAGFGYLAPGWVGVALAVIGLVLALVSVMVTRHDKRRSLDTVGIRVPAE